MGNRTHLVCGSLAVMARSNSSNATGSFLSFLTSACTLLSAEAFTAVRSADADADADVGDDVDVCMDDGEDNGEAARDVDAMSDDTGDEASLVLDVLPLLLLFTLKPSSFLMIGGFR